MPGLTKIGRTDQTVEDRMRSLNNTSVPFGFECFYAAEVKDSSDVEKRLHDAFQDLNIGKEFFKMHPMRAQRILEMVAISDKTPQENVEDEVENDKQLEPNREYLRRFSMFRIGLKAGDVLTFARGENITAEVVSDSEVNFEGTVLSLTAAALIAIKRCGYQWSKIAGPVYWLYNGQPLKEIERDYLDGQ
jgi:hypothetical protein